MYFYFINIKNLALIINAQQSSAIINKLLPFGFPCNMRKISLTTYWQNQESQTLLHMLPATLPRQHNVTSQSKALLLHPIGHLPTYRTPLPTLLSIYLNNIQNICKAKTG